MAPRSTWVPRPRHPARVDEVMEVLWSDYYGAALSGDEGELAYLPYTGCRLEVVAAVESAHHEVNRTVPGQVIRYAGTFCFLDRVKLASGTTVGLWHLIGFKLRLAPDPITPAADEDAILDRVRGKGGATVTHAYALAGREPARQHDQTVQVHNPGWPSSVSDQS